MYHITPKGIELAGDFVKKAQGEQYEELGNNGTPTAIYRQHIVHNRKS